MKVLPFDQVAIAQSDKGKRLKQRDYLAEGALPVIDQGQQEIGGYTDDLSMAFEGDLPVVLFGDHTRAVKLVNHTFAVGADGIKIFRPASGVRAKFLYYWMKCAPIPNRGYGRHYQFLRQLSVFLPSEAQQDEIVAELEMQFSRLDEAVANLQRVKANLKRYKATVLQSAVDGVLIMTTSSYSEVPLHELIGRISQGWSPKCDLNREALPDEWAVITTTAVQPMQYLDNQGKPLPADLAPRPGIEIKNGDFLMTRKGPRKRAGVACLVRSTRHRLMVCDTVYRFRCDESKILPDYLEIALNAPQVVDAIDRHKAGISESGVSLTHDKLGSVLIPLPSRQVQAAIVAEVDHHLSIIREVEAEVDTNLQRAQALRQATLARAFVI